MQQQVVSECVVQLENGAYQIAETRVSLDSIVYEYKRGETPAAIKSSFPILTVAQVRGCIAFYLEHQADIDEYLKNGEAELAIVAQQQNVRDRETRPELYARLERARRRLRDGREGNL